MAMSGPSFFRRYPVWRNKAELFAVQPVPFTAVRIDDSFWSPHMQTNRVPTVWYDFPE